MFVAVLESLYLFTAEYALRTVFNLKGCMKRFETSLKF